MRQFPYSHISESRDKLMGYFQKSPQSEAVAKEQENDLKDQISQAPLSLEEVFSLCRKSLESLSKEQRLNTSIATVKEKQLIINVFHSVYMNELQFKKPVLEKELKVKTRGAIEKIVLRYSAKLN